MEFSAIFLETFYFQCTLNTSIIFLLEGKVSLSPSHYLNQISRKSLKLKNIKFKLPIKLDSFIKDLIKNYRWVRKTFKNNKKISIISRLDFIYWKKTKKYNLIIYARKNWKNYGENIIFFFVKIVSYRFIKLLKFIFTQF